MQPAALAHLVVVDHSGEVRSPSSRGVSESDTVAPHFHLKTCERDLAVHLGSPRSLNVPSALDPQKGQVYRGREAYAFLLRLASGLESSLAGETEILGQLKGAWMAQRPQTPKALEGLFQHLWEDVKDVRSRYVQSWGSGQYASIVRKILRQDPVTSAPILLLGAGELATSIAPVLASWAKETGRPLWHWNRSPHRLAPLMASTSGVCVQESEGWQRAASVVACVPPEASSPTAREAWLQNPHPARTLIHLGARRVDLSRWEGSASHSARVVSLDEVFALSEQLRQARSAQIERARRACEERALLRSLHPSISVAHGWEDLALFQ